MEDKLLTGAANDFATAKHGDLIIKNADQYNATFATFCAGASWQREKDGAEIKELKETLSFILQTTRNAEDLPGIRLYDIANKVVSIRTKYGL